MRGRAKEDRPGGKAGGSARHGRATPAAAPPASGGLALVTNRLAAVMPWNGYTADASDRIPGRAVGNHRYTSIHIEELVVMARDTKLGPEEITRDIPNLAENQLARLDESGIVYVGAEVNPAETLVGK